MATPARPRLSARRPLTATLVTGAVCATMAMSMLVGAPAGRAQEVDPTLTGSTTSTTTTSTTTTLVPGTGPVGAVAPPVTGVGDSPLGAVPTSFPSDALPSTLPVPVAVASTVVVGGTVANRPENRGLADDFGAIEGATNTLPPGAEVAVGDVTDDDGAPEVPPQNVVVPPSPPYQAPANNMTLQAALAKLTAEQRKQVEIARVKADEATARLQAAQTALVTLSNQGASTKRDLQRLQSLRDATTMDMRDRALRQYTGESIGYLNLLLSSSDVNTLSRRADFVSQAQRRDAVLVKSYRETLQSLEAKQAELDVIVDERRREIDVLEQEQIILSEEFAKVDAQLQSITKGIPIALNGFVFPVQLPASFVDTYGADRMKGTKYYHFHQGVDIFAPHGTPLRAVKRGVVNNLGVAVLGGNKLWLTDADGTAYYYAHLSQFAVGIDNGAVVEAGQILGFVGNTGNAVGTPSHVHFEIHPGGGDPVNPTPILKAVKDSNINDLVKALNPTLPSLGSTTTVFGQTPPDTARGNAASTTSLKK